MNAVKELDSVRTTVAVEAIFSRRPIPAGSRGVVVEVGDNGVCLADFEIDTADDDTDFDQAELRPDQFEVIRTP